MERIVIVDNIQEVYTRKDGCCYYKAYNFMINPKPEKGFIGGFFDVLFKLKKGKKYKIIVKEINSN